MLKHSQIWRAIDRLAESKGLSPSGLARRAGLDSTTFNKSKRTTREGKPRWPSTESIAKILQATNTSLAEFTALVEGDGIGRPAPQTLPLIGFAQAGQAGYFDDAGWPVGAGWDEIRTPEVTDPHAYALEVSGDSMQPVYRDGDILVVAPDEAPRRGDRVVVRTMEGEVMVKELLRLSEKRVELKSLNPVHDDRSLAREQVEWIARVLWVSQ
ncbi:Phage repressor [Caenispirillum salinarum AK4]|uniref:Phage repressor n=1 Tax=Caenispirillum salinarum AK4 TaxID=1238182 RepID=K9GQP4_9PROT|nr:helix-turn-helix transcriptional regulator [Caenispirillum salinarum]EKV27049.1 Phage repressor [Caenispirillum salinarum AK4]